jgi:NO-binding membrane sensor protein with MHYT domain
MAQMPIFYFWPTVLLSLLLAIAASSVALSVVSSERLTARRLLGGGLMMGAGIGAMYYTGMAAMRTSSTELYTCLPNAFHDCYCSGRLIGDGANL